MSGLNENHKRRILTSLQYADKLLQENLRALAPGAQPLFGGYIQDLSPAKARLVEGYTRKIREQMARLLDQCGVQAQPPSSTTSGRLRTGITSLDLTLEDIYPEKMRGYGKMDAAAAHDLASTLREIRRFVSPLLALLGQAEPGRIAGIDSRPELAERIHRMAQIIADYELIEFLPALNSIARAAASEPEPIRVGTVSGQVDALRAALIMVLEKPRHIPTAPEAVNLAGVQIRRIEAIVDAFRHRWEPKCTSASTWSKELLDAVASRLANRSAGRDFEPAEVAAAVAEALEAQETEFQSEYAQLACAVQQGMEELRKHDPITRILAHDLRMPNGMPQPRNLPLADLAAHISDHHGRGGPAAHAKQMRAELQNKFGAAVEAMAQELHRRLGPWFLDAMESLEESVRAQTDPLRYGSRPNPDVSEEKRKLDISFLSMAI